jgi:hypothetical protein
MKELLSFLSKLFNSRQENIKVTMKFKTIIPEEQLEFEQWCKEFNVGMLWDKKIVHLG